MTTPTTTPTTVDQPCYGFHASSIPSHVDRVFDTQGRAWIRVGPRSWRQEVPLDQPARFYEPWLLENVGPMRCPVTEDALTAREEGMVAVLDRQPRDVTGLCVVLPESDAEVVYEDALMLLIAGWLVWTPKQRREAIASLREAEEAELAKTS